MNRHVFMTALMMGVFLCHIMPAASQGSQVVYVNGQTGSNSNNGTISSPFQTLNYTIGIICNNLNPTYTIVMAPVSTSFVYVEEIDIAIACATLDVTITSINPTEVKEQKIASGKALLDTPMARISWTSVTTSAVMSLVLDHLVFTGDMDLPFNPTLDLGLSALYSLTVQNCVFDHMVGYNVPIDMATDSQLKSGIQFTMTNCLVQNSNLGVSFIYTAGPTPTYASITNSQFENNINGPIFNGNSITVLVIDGCEFRNNNITDYQLVFSQGVLQQAGAPGAPPSAFNFTNNIVDSNILGMILLVHNNAGAYLVDHNKITNNRVGNSNSNSSSYYTGSYSEGGTEPIVITNNVFSCNRAADGTPYAFFGRDVEAGVTNPWILENNVNGDPTDCPIHAIAGAEMADPINAQSCLPGYYNNLDTGSWNHCVACPVGSMTQSYGSTSCLQCAPGSFASNLASVSCDLCQAGTHARAPGASVCADCNSGYYASQTGEIVCQKCASGWCTPSNGAWTMCVQAPCSSKNETRAEISLA